MHSAIDRFNAKLYADWLPAFCNDPRRRLDPSGFRAESVRVTALDAENVLRAFDAGVVADSGGGRFRCPASKAFEQFFWTGPKRVHPRPLTLWMEPVITVATVGRLNLEFGWATPQIGMQSADWAFDLMVYGAQNSDQVVLAGEVKKSIAEVDHLRADMRAYSAQKATAPFSRSPRHINSYRKWAALRAVRAPFFFAVGPGGYSHALRVDHSSGDLNLLSVPLSMLHGPNS